MAVPRVGQPNQQQNFGGFNLFGGQGRRQGQPAAAPSQFPVSSGNNPDDARALVNSIFPSLTAAAPQALDTGLGTLQQILGLQGATDPALFNRQLADISRTGQGQSDALQSQLSRLGLQNSMAGQGLGVAIGQGTADRRAGAFAQEQALQEERKRSDLINLLLPLLIQPGQQASSNLFGLAGQPSDPSDLEKLLGFAQGGLTSYVTGGLF